MEMLPSSPDEECSTKAIERPSVEKRGFPIIQPCRTGPCRWDTRGSPCLRRSGRPRAPCRPAPTPRSRRSQELPSAPPRRAERGERAVHREAVGLVIGIHEDRHLAGRRDRQQARRGQRQDRGLGVARPQRVDAGRRPVPRGRVVDRAAVRGEACVADGAASEGQALEGGLRRGGRPPAGEEAQESGRDDRRQSQRPERPAARGFGDSDGADPGRGARDLADVLAHALQVAGEVARRGVTLVGILRVAALHDPAKRRRRPRVQLCDRLGLVLDDRRERLRAGALLKRALPRRHLVEDRAQRELIRTEVDRAPARLLRRHVADRPHDRPRRRLLVDRRRRVRRLVRRGKNSFARPKSSSLTKPSLETMTFSGLRSRWTMPAECAFARPSAICTATSSSLFVGSAPRRERSRRLVPSTNSIAM